MFGSTFGGWLSQGFGGLLAWQWLGIVVSVAGGLPLGLLVARGVHMLVASAVKRTRFVWDDIVVRACFRPLRYLCVLIAVYALLTDLQLPEPVLDIVAKVFRASGIALLAWGAIRSLYRIADAVTDGVMGRETFDPERLTRARALRTQLVVTTRVLSMVVFVLGVAAMALQFDVVRSVGMSLLASAGLAGVVLGFAAQKSLGAILAGLQLSLSQPIRIGDHVVFQGEFGTIDDIGLTYVEIRLWDDRRLMVPTIRFLEEPLQNWSRSHLGLVGTVFLRVAFDTPLDQVRQVVERLTAAQSLWDGRMNKVQVTDVGERVLELRVLVSARSPADLFDLRSAVREGLVRWLSETQGGVYLPSARVAMLDGPLRARRTTVDGEHAGEPSPDGSPQGSGTA
jgi:small-conductance mechanosensitive channel